MTPRPKGQGIQGTFRLAEASSSKPAVIAAQDSSCDRDSLELDLYALVTKLLDRKEWIKDPKAVAKAREEFDGLTGKDTWDLDSVDEHSNVVRNAKLAGKIVHIADIMSICSRKYDETQKTRVALLPSTKACQHLRLLSLPLTL